MNDTADTLHALLLIGSFMVALVATVMTARMVFSGPHRNREPISLVEENVHLRMECFKLRDQLAAARTELEETKRDRGFRLHLTLRKEDATGSMSGELPVIQDTITRKEHQ